MNMNKIETFKGRKMFAVMGRPDGYAHYVNNDIESTKKGLDSDTPYLVELTVTRVFTRERDLKEIETEI